MIKECIYCRKEKPYPFIDDRSEYGSEITIIDNNARVCGRFEHEEEFKINYCPMCGKALK